MAAAPARGRLDERILNEVPEVTVCSWIIEVPATTVGETAATVLENAFGSGRSPS